MNTSPEKIDHLIQQFHSSDFTTRRRAGSELVKIGQPAVNALLLALQDKNWQTRVNAADVLAAIGDAESISILYAMLPPLVYEYGTVGCAHLSDVLRALNGFEGYSIAVDSFALARCVVRANHLPRERRVEILEQIRSGLRNGEQIYSHPLPAVADLCQKMLHDKDGAVRQGAGEILAASTLLRASSAEASSEPSVLLRAAQGAASHDAPEQLLRGSMPDPLPAPHAAAPSRTVWQRFLTWLLRRKAGD